MPTGGLAEWLVPLLWKTAASFAMNVITNKVFGKKTANTSPTYSIGTLQTQCNSNQVMPLIYGRVKCAGNSLWQDGSGSTVNRLVGFSLGKNYGVSDVRLDDIDINTLAGCNYTAYMGDGVQTIDGRVAKETVTTYAYTDTVPAGVQTGETWVDGDYTWTVYYDTSYHTVRSRRSTGTAENTLTTNAQRAKVVGSLKYDAYLAFTIKASDKISSNPNVTAVWQGRIVKVYTTPTEYTEAWSNNVWCILDFMTSPDGCNIPVENIDIQSFIDAAAYAQPGDGTRDWQLNLILDEKKSRQDWLNEMLLCFRAYRTYQNGKHGLLIDKPEPVSQIFTVKPTETIQIDWQELSEDVERIILKYPDPDYEWQNVGAPATMPTPFRNGTPLTKTVEVHGVTNFKQASQLSWFYLNQAQTCGEYITYTCNKRALNRTIGDVIGIYDPITKRTEEGLDYKRYRIMAMTEPQGMSIQLYCREYNADLYGDTLGSVDPVVSTSNQTDHRNELPDAVTNLTVNSRYVQNADGQVSYDLVVEFAPADYYLNSHVEVWYQIASVQGIAEGVAITEGVALDELGFSDTWKYAGSGVNQVVIPQVKFGETYRVKAIAVNRYNHKSINNPTADITVQAKTTVPNTPQNFSVSFSDKVNFSWSAVTNSDVDYYEIRTDYNAGNQTGMLARTSDTSIGLSLTERTDDIYLFAHNATKKYSAFAKLTYSLSAPKKPATPTYQALLLGFCISSESIPNNSIGMNVYITKDSNTQKFYTVNNTYTHSGEAGIYAVQVAFVDMFGEGLKSGILSVTIKTYLDPALIEQESLSLEKMDSVMKESLINSSVLLSQFISLIGTAAQYSGIAQVSDDIQLRVKNPDGSTSLINVSPDTITLQGKYLHVTGDTVFDAGVIADHIETGSISSTMLAAESITADKIASDAITADKIASDAITSDKISVTSLDALASTIGTLRTATTGARVEISDNLIKVYDTNNVLRVRMGVW